MYFYVLPKTASVSQVAALINNELFKLQAISRVEVPALEKLIFQDILTPFWNKEMLSSTFDPPTEVIEIIKNQNIDKVTRDLAVFELKYNWRMPQSRNERNFLIDKWEKV